MKVLKFGGSSLKSASDIIQIKNIVEKESGNTIVVVSAFDGITDRILNAAQMAQINTKYSLAELRLIRLKHLEIIDKVFESEGKDKKAEINAKAEEIIDKLTNEILGISENSDLNNKRLDNISSYGEVLSTLLINSFIPNSTLIDTSKVIKTDSNFGSARVDFTQSRIEIKKLEKHIKGICIAPGYLGTNKNGDITTLGRGGSDYVASILATELGASALEIWTNVDGFMTADPRVISKAYVIESLGYVEAMELSHFGSKVLYPPTLVPVYQAGIPTYIKNTLKPDAKGTLIAKTHNKSQRSPIKGISSVSNISLISVQGIGMVRVTGISMRLFSALAKKNVNVILISQTSSENSISVAVNSSHSETATIALQNEFAREIESGQISTVDAEDNLSVVAIVGEEMKKSTGIAGKLFTTIGNAGINVIAIATGASELNISWVIRSSELRKTLNSVHEAFFLSEHIELNVFLLGVGLVGDNLVTQIHQQQEKLLKENNLKLKVVGIANSKQMHIDRKGIKLENYKELLKEGTPGNYKDYCDEVLNLNIFNSVFVDCTASNEVPDIYSKLLDSNVSIVAANKVAASSGYTNYRHLKDLANARGSKFLFETNVGAGLPIINTINDLVKSGDKILRIEAVLSGTLNYIFSTLSDKISFSEAVKMAKDLGFSEPDPRIDLSGTDVMRKLLILCREAGYMLESNHIKLGEIIDEKFFEGSLDDFWKNLPSLDEKYENERKTLVANNQCFRYVAKFENNVAKVGLEAIGNDHPFYDLEGSNNIIMLTTERYKEFPMMIKGYGAGAAVTAAGVFADIIKVSNI